MYVPRFILQREQVGTPKNRCLVFIVYVAFSKRNEVSAIKERWCARCKNVGFGLNLEKTVSDLPEFRGSKDFGRSQFTRDSKYFNCFESLWRSKVGCFGRKIQLYSREQCSAGHDRGSCSRVAHRSFPKPKRARFKGQMIFSFGPPFIGHPHRDWATAAFQ